MTLTDRMEAETSRLRYKFWQADNRDWSGYVRFGTVKNPGTDRIIYPVTAVKFMGHNKAPRKSFDHEMAIWGYWYDMAKNGQWRRSFGF